MTQEMTRADFLKSFASLEKSFESSLDQAKNLDSKFEQSFQTFEKNIKNHINAAKKVIASDKDNALGQQLSKFIDTLNETNQSWSKKLANKDKGIAFRKNFSDSLLVFVYGKVKSGKSSLGNYIAWGKTENLEEVQKNIPISEQPNYFSAAKTNVRDGDAEKEAETNRSFRVGATEATSSIQGFKLPGLTWVDSPGLHSYNDENGLLAKEYVDHADLILYTMSSQSPGRASDLAEIDQLFNQNKKLVVLITGSDIEEEIDVVFDEFGNEEIISETVMKPSSDRIKQREYVKKELEMLKNHSHPEILSISSRYAETHENDREAMKESGFSDLFEILVNISQQEGVQLKRSTPLNNFKSFIRECDSELKPYSDLLDAFEKNVKKIDSGLLSAIQTHTFKAQTALQDLIKQDFRRFASENHSPEMVNATIKDQQKRWNQSLNEITNNAIGDVFSEIMTDFKEGVIASWEGTNIDLPSYDVEKVKKSVPSGYKKGTKRSRGGLGSLLGGGVGALLGGPVGMGIGATAGGFLGSMFGEKSEITTKQIDVVVGDNLVDIERKALETYTNAIQTFMNQEASKIQKIFIDNAQTFIGNIGKELAIIQEMFNELTQETDAIINGKA